MNLNTEIIEVLDILNQMNVLQNAEIEALRRKVEALHNRVMELEDNRPMTIMERAAR